MYLNNLKHRLLSLKFVYASVLYWCELIYFYRIPVYLYCPLECIYIIQLK